MFYFDTRKQARTFATRQDHYRVVDSQDQPSTSGQRWAVKVL